MSPGLAISAARDNGAFDVARRIPPVPLPKFAIAIFSAAAPISSASFRVFVQRVAQQREIAAFVFSAENHEQDSPGNASSAFSVASTFVALESLK